MSCFCAISLGQPSINPSAALFLGKAITSRISFSPNSRATNRSNPIANPPCGGAPYSNAESKNLEIENNIPENLFVKADINSVSTVFRNLLSNAIKYSFDSGTIAIDAEEKDNYSYISVTDSGQGIDPENIPRLFKIDEGFSTKGTQKEEGTGLGLIICKEFIEKNGGTISVNSKKGEGSSFTISLPKAG